MLCDDMGGRDCRALRIVWRGTAESMEHAFLRCFRMRFSPNECTRGSTVRFSIEDEALIAVDWSFRDDSSEVEMVGVGSDAAGAPPISVVATGEALYGASLGQWTLVCGGCGE
jgi:hypothetical protein